MAQWDESADFVIVGSGGGSFCAALAVKDAGKTPIVLEKTDKVGGSTSMSGGVLWVPTPPSATWAPPPRGSARTPSCTAGRS
jgi:3-oxosteroid 1-dehydrogenase